VIRPGHEELRTTVPGTALAAASIELVADYVERHLFDTGLTAQTIARAHLVSVRHLYAVWSVNPVPFREWIIRARLEQARR
jgi:AraC-like DNA-binding protein